jgi:putative transposase
MARKRYKPEEIVAKLRQIDVLVSQGQTMMDAIRQIGVSERIPITEIDLR